MRHKCSTILLIFQLFFSPVLSQGFYEPLNVPKIELTFAENDWQFPLHYYHSLKKGDRHIGHLKIDSVEFDSVGVRFKGFSSYKRKNKKNPLNIKIDHIRKKADYQKYETLKLSNGNLDPSWLREILAYEIARKYMVAPQSNYAEVYVNTAYYGLFGNTESVDKKFAKRYLDFDKNNVIIKGNSPLGPFSGKRSSLEYLGPDTNLYKNSYELKSDTGWEELFKLIDILNNRPEKIESILNMDGAIWMLAFNNVLINLDSYSDFQQNYYLIQDNNGRFNFIPWDLNLAFDGLGKPQGVTIQYDYDPLAKQNDNRFPLINLVLNNPHYRKIYFAHCITILNENFSNGWYKNKAEKYRTLIADAVSRDTNWNFSVNDFDNNLTQTVTPATPGAFPYPGLTELMDARIKFLQDHQEYRNIPPNIRKVNTDFSEMDSTGITVTVEISKATNAFVFFRKKSSDIFQKIPLNDDGKNIDKKAGDGIFSAFVPLGKKKVEYYIFAENKNAVQFSPYRAEHEFYVFKKKEGLPF
ncbi:MAG: CotH kinase family protein [Bacteroidota bacterium]